MIKPVDEFIYGPRPLIEAIESGREIEKVFLKKNLQGDNYQYILRLVKERSIPFQFVPIEKLNRITRKNHQGIIAYISPISFQSLDQVIPAIYESGEDPLIILLDGVTDVRNFGAVARTAECAGVHAMVIPHHGSARINADSLKTSAGALNRIPVCRVPNLVYAVSYLRNSGLMIFGSSEKAEKLYTQMQITGPSAFIFGSEDKGISTGLMKRCDELFRIPVMGQISSLNVSAAVAILIYEAVRQRMPG
jgi:23S rRNA (guanosine2251-2'-O)-methyltransferase